jgi:hypothetical protein
VKNEGGGDPQAGGARRRGRLTQKHGIEGDWRMGPATVPVGLN